MKRLLNIKDAAEYMGRTVAGMRKLVWNGQIRFVQPHPHSRLYFDIKDLDAFIEKNRVAYPWTKPVSTNAEGPILKKRLLNLKDAAVYLGLSKWQTLNLFWNYEISIIQQHPRSGRYFDVRELDAYLRKKG